MKARNPQRQKLVRRQRRHGRIRTKVLGTAARPRLAVYRSLRQIIAQLVDDTRGCTLLAVTEKALPPGKAEPVGDRGGKQARAFALGKMIAAQAQKSGITTVVFDRGGFAYHGRIRAFAEGARAGGLTF